MGHIKLVGVSVYPVTGLPALPMCVNDVQAVKKAFISGLKVTEGNIYVCGNNGIIFAADLLKALTTVLATTTPDDTFIFYFSGHNYSSAVHLYPPFSTFAVQRRTTKSSRR